MMYMNAITGRKRRYERLTESGDGDGAPALLSSLSFIGITPVVFVRASNYRSVDKFARLCAPPRWGSVPRSAAEPLRLSGISGVRL